MQAAGPDCPVHRGLLMSARGADRRGDGDTHKVEVDLRRDCLLGDQAYRTIRFTNDDVMQNMEGVLSTIIQTFHAAPDRWPASHPNLSPKGNGL